MTYDLFFHDYGMQAFTQKGRDFIGTILSKRPMFPRLDYREAVAEGLQVSFRSKSIAEEILMGDPGSTSAIIDNGPETVEGNPIPAVTDVPEAIEDLDNGDCGELEDSPDAALCEAPVYDQDEETEIAEEL